MTPSPRLLALATLLAPIILFLLAHEARGATRPAVAFTPAPAAVTSSRSATLPIARTTHGRLRTQRCRIDRSTWRPCAHSFTVRDLADGLHVARVRLVLRNGATASAAATWRVDTAAPSAPEAIGGSPAWTAEPSRSVTHGASTDPDPGSGMALYRSRVSVDGGATWSAAPGAGVVITREGETMVEYAAFDEAGNISVWSPPAVVRLDRTAPTAPDASADGAWTAAPSVEVVDQRDATDALSGIDPDGYEMQTSEDGGETWGASAPEPGGVVTFTAEGERLVRFRAHDRAGNAGPWSAVPALVRIDRTAPAVPTVAGAPAGWTANAAVHLDAGEGAEFQDSTDGGTTWSDAAADVASEGVTLVRARACDEAANCSGWSAPVTVAIDRTPPTAPAAVTGGDGGNPSCLFQETQEVSFTASPATDTGSGIDHYMWKLNRFNEAPLAPTGVGSAVHLTYHDVMLSVRIRFAAVDAAGNVGPWSDGSLPGANVCLVPPV